MAHSMGGLVCRCLLQKILPERGEDPADHVDKFFTYGTPHGGIAFDVGSGLVERLMAATGVAGADVFAPRRMYEYLTPDALREDGGPPRGWDPREIPEGRFPPHRVFCLVGTDPTDYDVAHGLSARAVGARSDGLVQIDNAQVPHAQRAFVHRSHSGRYGLVNSEEGYQNLQRFLFGDLRVQAELVGVRLPGEGRGISWQAEVRLAVRGLPGVMHEQLAAHWCPIQLPRPHGDGSPADPVPLATTFLNSRAPRPPETPTLRYALHLRILSLRERDGILRFTDHLEQTADFADILVVDVGSAPQGPGVWAVWNSDLPGAIWEHRPTGAPCGDEDPRGGVWLAHIPLPATAAPILGEEASVRLTVTPWS
ncbi:hypothetical protein J2X68_005764 [Streptomyces sp. 3330]|nr:hypothetical protein [Streptomyces sp. 3330]